MSIKIVALSLCNWNDNMSTESMLSSVYRLGDLLNFGQLFKASGSNYFAQISLILRLFLYRCQNLSFFKWNHFWPTFIDIWQFFSGHTGYNSQWHIIDCPFRSKTSCSAQTLARASIWSLSTSRGGEIMEFRVGQIFLLSKPPFCWLGHRKMSLHWYPLFPHK